MTSILTAKESFVKKLYRELSEITGQAPEAFQFDNFEHRDGKLYYRDKITPLTIRGGKLTLSMPGFLQIVMAGGRFPYEIWHVDST